MRSLLAAAAALSTLVGASAALTKCQVVDMLRSGGIPSQYIAPMTCTAFYESSWNPTAQHKNTDGSTDYGLFQINNVYWCYDSTHPGKANGCNSACSTLLTAGPNIACAAIVLKQQGITAWYGYKNHESTCQNYDISTCGGGGGTATPQPVPSPSHDSTGGTGGGPTSGAGNGTSTGTGGGPTTTSGSGNGTSTGTGGGGGGSTTGNPTTTGGGGGGGSTTGTGGGGGGSTTGTGGGGSTTGTGGGGGGGSTTGTGGGSGGSTTGTGGGGGTSSGTGSGGGTSTGSGSGGSTTQQPPRFFKGKLNLKGKRSQH